MVISLDKQSIKVLVISMVTATCLPILLQAEGQFGWYFTEGGVGVDSYWGPATDVVIPAQIDGYPVVRIDEYYSCLGLFGVKPEMEDAITSITFPDSVTSIYPGIFWEFPALSNFYVGEGNSHYSSLDGVLCNKEKTCLIDFPAGRDGNYIIPNTIESIGPFAFDGCIYLESVTIPASVNSIDWAFDYCDSLTSVCFMGLPPSLTDGAFILHANPELTVYYIEGTPGWGSTFDGIPTAPFTPWGKYVPFTSELGTHTDTCNWLGMLEVTLDPWVWCERGNCWFNIPEETASAGQGWVYSPDHDSLLIAPVDGIDWCYSFALGKWLYLDASGWVYVV